MSRDPKLISIQSWERWWIRWRYKVPKEVLNECIKQSGKGRQKVYNCLRYKGYKI